MFAEPDAAKFARAIFASSASRMSAVNWVEASVRFESLAGGSGAAGFDDLVRRGRIGIELVTAEQGRLARGAYRAYGKRHHRAGLDLGDCFACALAKATGEPLLFKGADFAHTDIVAAI